MPKQPDRVTQKLVNEWLQKADPDLRLAEFLLAENAPFWDAIAFHCQQAAEKYLKAYLISRQIEFPKTHNIRELLGFVASVDKKLALYLKPTTILTPYGVLVRYPDDSQRVDPKKAEMAVGLAQKVEKSVKKKLKGFLK
jgi:HEPN domain-containing protein